MLLALAACSGPPSHATLLWPEGKTGEPVLGVSTEDGVLVLAEPGYAVDQLFQIRFRAGNSVVTDWGRIDRMNDHVAVVRPLYAQLLRGRIAHTLPEAHETIYLATRSPEDEPVMAPGRLWEDGAHGDFLVLEEGDPVALAERYAGSGVYVQRDGRWQIVGLLSGLTAGIAREPDEQPALGFIGLTELARILPRQVRFYERDIKPLRPDFEYGVPLQPGDIDLAAEEKTAKPVGEPPPEQPRAGGPR